MTPNIGHNGMSRDEWLHVILSSGEVTRIAQHLALVIYHLSDPSTNLARLSARDLETITGWGRTTIRQHVDELELFIRVTWGQGRAKAIFELQGVIAEAVKPLKMARDAAITASQVAAQNGFGHVATNEAATTVATTNAAASCDRMSGVHVVTTENGEPNGHKNEVHTATTAATTFCGEPSGHKTGVNDVFVSGRWPQNRFGGVGGVTNNSSIPDSLSHREVRAKVVLDRGSAPEPYQIHDDGSVSGTAFEHFTATEVATFRTTYPHLEFPSELVAADQALAAPFDRDGLEFGSRERFGRLHQYLSKRNRDAGIAIKAAIEASRAKEAINEDASCWFDGDRLMVANGFKSDLMVMVGNDEDRLRITLDKAAASVPLALRGNDLKRVVRGQFARNVDWDRRDDRRVDAVAKRSSGGAPQSGSSAPVESRADRIARQMREAAAKEGNR